MSGDVSDTGVVVSGVVCVVVLAGEVEASVVLVVSFVPVAGGVVVSGVVAVVLAVSFVSVVVVVLAEVAVVVSPASAGVLVASVVAGAMGSGLWLRSGLGSLGDCGLSAAAVRSAPTGSV